MRVSLRSIVAFAAVAGVIFACGSSDESTFTNTNGDDAGVVEPPPGTFVPPSGNDGGTSTCKPLTCADLKANCGPIGDGCGGVVDCGACTGQETCGGGGTASVCGKPACTPLTCTQIGADCGLQADGCGNTISCWPNDASTGTCPNPGEFCGGGGTSKCGTGVVGDGGTDGGTGTCVPKTCTDLGAGCGMQSDGCGGQINCWPGGGSSCPVAGQTCGGGGTPNQCGSTCKPKTSCTAGKNCGVEADGCGGVVSCYPAGTSTCEAGTCGGGGTPGVCGSATTCTGLCTQQVKCDSGTTSISGTVTSPNGVLPIYGALVFVPTTTPAAFTTGVSCDQCGASAGTPLVSTTTGPDGKFLLSNMPVSSGSGVVNIPVVIQLGRWRKQITVQTSACTNVTVPAVNAANALQLVGGAARPAPDLISSALPRNKNEGDIPLTAISTGAVDGLECVFKKIGIDQSEFTDPSGNGRIRFYQDNGAVISAASGTCSVSTAACGPSVGGTNQVNFGSNCPSTCSGDGLTCTTVGAACGHCSNSTSRSCTNIGGSCGGSRGTCVSQGTCTSNGVCTQSGGTPPASTLYNDPNELAKYDMTLFECVGNQVDKTATQQANVRDYANKGGRVYATHYSYVWLYNGGAAPWNGTATWNPNQAFLSDQVTPAIATLDTSFAKGQAFAQWLNIVGGLNAALPSPNPPWNPPPKISIYDSRHDVDLPITAPAQGWLYTTAGDYPNVSSVQHYTFNTDWTKTASQQCGRVLFSDFHVTVGSSTNNKVFPAECVGTTLSSQEKVLAFMLFDLASCVSQAPPPPACKPLSCADQGIQCGQAGDGCGNIITCPNCPAGQTCGGGGTPNVCGASSCTPSTCPAGTCGTVADGCGGTAACAPCPAGQTCGGGGTPGVCGTGATCTKGTCPTPAAGSQCGPVADGCGGLLSCQCPAGYSCINGTCATSTCTPRTCAQAGANCGQIADGCGGLLNCGTCLSPQTCGGGGTPNVCGGGVN